MFSGYFAMGLGTDPWGFESQAGEEEEPGLSWEELKTKLGNAVVYRKEYRFYQVKGDDFWKALPESFREARLSSHAYKFGCIGVGYTCLGGEGFGDVLFYTQRIETKAALFKSCYLKEKQALAAARETKCEEGLCPRILAFQFWDPKGPMAVEMGKEREIEVSKNGRIANASDLWRTKKRRPKYIEEGRVEHFVNFNVAFRTTDGWYIHATVGGPQMKVRITSSKEFNEWRPLDFNRTMYCVACGISGRQREQEPELPKYIPE